MGLSIRTCSGNDCIYIHHFETIILRNRYLEQVRSIGGESYVDDLDSLQEDSFQQELETETIENQEDSIIQLKEENKLLKKQVKYLRKIVVLNMFDSKQDVKDFFSDIW